ncbi:MAG: MIP/aquaporin family protein [Candidatus Nanopelagicales bacterium]
MAVSSKDGHDQHGDGARISQMTDHPSELLATAADLAEQRIRDFEDPRQEWRRLVSELVGTFFLVLVAAGAPMVAHVYPGTVTLAAAVIAPGAMVMAMIMFMGKVSGAHFNPGVSMAFALRGDFPWIRLPGYVAAQLIGALGAAVFLQLITGTSSRFGGSYPGAGTPAWAAFLTELICTFGLLSVILGTSSGAQNIGIMAAIGVGSYIALAGLWAAPLSGASMNTIRTLGPNLVGGDLGPIWVYIAGPLIGAALAVGMAFVLRGSGGGVRGSLAAQGMLDPNIRKPHKA